MKEKSIGDWTKEFDETFVNVSMTIKRPDNTMSEVYAGTKIKDFISRLLSEKEKEAYERGMTSRAPIILEKVEKSAKNCWNAALEAAEGAADIYGGQPPAHPDYTDGWDDCRTQTLENIAKLKK